MSVQLDTTSKTQVNTPIGKNQRSIYDAGYGEIFWKSTLAGFSLGLGQALASLIFYALILGLFLSYIAPTLDQFMTPINRLIPILERSTQQTQGFDDQINSLFNSLQRPAPSSSQSGPEMAPQTDPATEPSMF